MRKLLLIAILFLAACGNNPQGDVTDHYMDGSQYAICVQDTSGPVSCFHVTKAQYDKYHTGDKYP